MEQRGWAQEVHWPSVLGAYGRSWAEEALVAGLLPIPVGVVVATIKEGNRYFINLTDAIE